MNAQEIVKKWLEKNGYDGLYSGICECELEDLMSCETPLPSCTAGYRTPCISENCELDGKCKYHIGGEKNENKNSMD